MPNIELGSWATILLNFQETIYVITLGIIIYNQLHTLLSTGLPLKCAWCPNLDISQGEKLNYIFMKKYF